MSQFNVYQAKTQLSKLIQDALDGEDVVIARDGVPAVRLVPIRPTPPPSRLGFFPGIVVADNFDDPLEEFELSEPLP